MKFTEHGAAAAAFQDHGYLQFRGANLSFWHFNKTSRKMKQISSKNLNLKKKIIYATGRAPNCRIARMIDWCQNENEKVL